MAQTLRWKRRQRWRPHSDKTADRITPPCFLSSDHTASTPTRILPTRQSKPTTMSEESIATPSNPDKTWYQDQIRKRLALNYNLSMIIVGETGVGKSYFGLKNLETFDPKPSTENIVFTAKDFVKQAKTAKHGTWILFDEPGLGLSHRTWWSEWNRVTSQIIQSSRFLGINFLFTLPQTVMMDIDARRIAHAQAIMRSRGFAVIYRIKHNYFSHSPDTYTPRVGSVEFGLPTKEFAESYEDKRSAFHDSFFAKYYKDQPEQPQEAKVIDIVKKNPADYIDATGQISAKKIVEKHGVSYTTAYKIKAQIEGPEKTD